MRLVLALACVAFACLFMLSGCSVYAQSPVGGWITVDQKGPVAVGDLSIGAGNKVGRGRSEGVLVVAWGDSSIDTAARSAGITQISHVDSQVLNVLGIYARYDVVVYGK